MRLVVFTCSREHAMAGAKGVSLIRGKEPLLKALGLVVEYESGELYFDRSGRVIRNLHDTDSGWLREARPTSGKTQVLNPRRELVFEFGPTTAAVACSLEGTRREIEQPTKEAFPALAADAMRAVVDELDISAFQRISYKEQYALPTDSVEETEEWIRSLGVVRVAPELYTAYGQTHFAMSWAVLVVGKECRYRIGVGGQEKFAVVPTGSHELSIQASRAQRHHRTEYLQLMKAKRDRQLDPSYFVSVDIEAYLWDEFSSEFDLASFVATQAESCLPCFRNSIPKEAEQK